MLNSLRTRKRYLQVTLILTAICVIFGVLSASLALDNGYDKPGVLTVCRDVLTAISILYFAVLPFFIAKESAAASADSKSLAAALPTLLLLLCFVALVLEWKKLNAPGLLLPLSLLSLPFAIAFFLTKSLPQWNVSVLAQTVFGGLLILFLTCLLCLTYFDNGLAMNAPQKLGLHLALVSFLLFLVLELRQKAGIARPRLHLALSALSFFACFKEGAEGLLGLLLAGKATPLPLACHLLLLSLAVYVAMGFRGAFLTEGKQ